MRTADGSELKRTEGFLFALAKDDIGKWMELNSVRWSVSVTFGKWSIHMTRRKVHSYSDDRGEHIEEWSTDGNHEKFEVAFNQAFDRMLMTIGGK